MRNCYFNFVCEKQWHELEPTKEVDARHCAYCNKKVFLVHNINQFKMRAQSNECIALFPDKFVHSANEDNEENEEKAFSDRMEILLRVGEVLSGIDNANYYLSALWKNNFLKVIEVAQSNGYLLYSDISNNVSFKLDLNHIEELKIIFNNYDIAVYVIDPSFELTLVGSPDMRLVLKRIDVILGPLSELEIPSPLYEKLEILEVKNIREMLSLPAEQIITECKLEDSEIEVLNSILASWGLRLGMNIHDK